MTALATLPVVLGTGVHGSRPAAGDVGKGGLYSCTTHSLVYQTDGSTWTTWATLGGTPTSPALVFLEAHSASNSATLDFTSFISSTYETYKFEFVDIIPATAGQDLLMRVGTGGGPTYDAGSNYYGSVGGTANDSTGLAYGYNTTGLVIFRVLDNTAVYGVGQASITFQGPQNTSSGKHIMGTSAWHNGSKFYGAFNGGFWNSATAVTAVRFLMTSGNITSGTIRVYGVVKV